MIDSAVLEALANDGYIRRSFHPSGKLAIYNYTEKCAYEGHWDDATRQCRGLILDEQFNVVARPFPKFFNYGEPNAPELDLDARVVVTDKLDGLLGILYPDPLGGLSVATRGSFTSDQAIHATAVWRDRYADVWEPLPDMTYLFEIIYPSNRIVVDYQGLDDLVLLGAMANHGHGWLLPTDSDWPGPTVDVHPYASLRAALEAVPRPGQEGLVVHFPDSNARVKIKQDDYVQIHRLVFGLTKRKLWERVGIEMLSKEGRDVKFIARTLYMDPADVEAILPTIGSWMDDLLQVVPKDFEEFADWAVGTTAEIGSDVLFWVDGVENTYDDIGRDLRGTTDRAAFAEAFKAESDLTHALFALMDGKSVVSYALRAVQPQHETYKPLEEEL